MRDALPARVGRGPRVRWIVLAAIVIAGSALRIWLNNVTVWSVADESAYLRYTEFISGRGFLVGYRALNEIVIADPGYWLSPLPNRWLYFLVTSTLCGTMTCDFRMLAWFSTVCGIAAIPLSWAVARRLLGEGVALVTAALVAVSPLQLAMGRRALQDEVFAAFLLLALLCFLRVLDLKDGERGFPSYALAAVTATLAFGIRESFLFYWVAFGALVLMHARERRRIADLLLLGAPLLLNAAIYVALVRDPGALLAIARILQKDSAAPIVQEFHAGPPQQVIIDFLILSPLVTLLGIAAIAAVVGTWRAAPVGARRLVVFTVVSLGVLAFTPKDIRYSIGVDSPLRMLAAFALVTQWQFVAGRMWLVATLVAANAVVELSTFNTVFLVGAVYDPVIVDLLHALGAIPR